MYSEIKKEILRLYSPKGVTVKFIEKRQLSDGITADDRYDMNIKEYIYHATLKSGHSEFVVSILHPSEVKDKVGELLAAKVELSDEWTLNAVS